MLTVPSLEVCAWALRKQAAVGLLLAVGLMMGAGCTAPTLPSTTPTAAQVPFLNQQLTQDQIRQWRSTIGETRQHLKEKLFSQKQACYQRFFVNACLDKSLDAYRAEESVLRLQEIELARQERALTAIDRELRLQQKSKSQKGG